jgi:glycosyltransferase involved in cell wall biosynthesis
MDKIKILHVIGALGIGGCEKQLLELCKRLDKAQFELSLIWYSHLPGFEKAAWSMGNAFKDAGIKTIYIDKFSMPLFKFIFLLRKTIKYISPDIAHSWLYSANFWGRWAAFFCGVPHLIASYRSQVKREFDDNLIVRLSERILAKRTLKLANSRAVARSLAKYYGIPQSEIYVIYNAISDVSIDAETARSEIRQELGLPEQQKLAVMVANQHKEKNYSMLIRTAKHVCNQRNDITFVGVGRGDMIDELKPFIDQYDVKEKMIFVGQRDDVPRWLAAADVFCFTSDFEGFPNAILEAMIAGLPVVTTDYPGVDEIVRGDDIGIIVSRNDEKAMAKQILFLLDNPDAANRMGVAAQKYVAQHYSWNQLIGTMEKLYLNLYQYGQPIN